MHSNVGPKTELRNREKDKERNHDREIHMEILWVVSEKNLFVWLYQKGKNLTIILDLHC